MVAWHRTVALDMGGQLSNQPLEIVAVGDPRAEMLAILRRYARMVRDGHLVGIMVIGELEVGAYRSTVCSTANLAERLGRLKLLASDMIAAAREDDAVPFGEDDDE